MSKLAPELDSWLRDYNKLWQELEAQGFEYTPHNAREGLANLTFKLVKTIVPVAEISDTLITGERNSIPVRIYRDNVNQPKPILVYLHGGGHMCGSIEVYDRICRQLALATQHIVVAVEYRLAPEFPYPSGIEDAEQVVRQIRSMLDQLNISYVNLLSVAGDSGGGAMTASLAHRLQHDVDYRIDKQILIYPSLDYSMQHESINSNGRGYLLHRDKIEWFFSQYLQHDEDPAQVSPLYMEFGDTFPHTLIITAEFCPLRDEGLRYVEKLEQAKVMHQHVHFGDMIHAFLNMQDVVPDQCAQVYRHIGKFLSGT